MKKLKKIFPVLLLFICVVLAGTACGKKNTNTMDKNTVYRESDIDLKMAEGESLYNLISLGDRLAFSGNSYDEATYTNSNFLLTCNMDGSDVVRKVVSGEENTWLENAFAVGDKLYAVFTSYTERWEGEEYFYSSNRIIKVFDKMLNELKTIDLSNVAGDSYIESIYPLGNGNLLLYSYEKMYLVDENFKTIKSADSPEKGIMNMVMTRDGRPVVQSWGNNGYEICQFDLNTLSIGDKVNMPALNYNYSLRQGATYDMLFVDGQGVYGFNIGDVDLTPIMNFINSDLSTSYFDELIQMGDGSFIGAYYDWIFENYNRKLCRYTKVDPADVKDKQVLTLGTLYLADDIRREIITFNKNNDEYRITVKDYSVYENQDNWNAGVEKLNSDIASGQSPDIVIANNTSTIVNYISKGLFIDLNKYLDNDSEIKKEDIFPNLLEAASYKGKLYSIIPYFYLDTLVGKTANLGGRTSWNIQEMIDYANSLPEGKRLLYGATRESFMTNVLEINSGYFVNSATGQCRFDSPEFIQLLEFCKKLPAEINYDNGGIIVYDKAIASEDYDWEEVYSTYRADKTMVSEQSFTSFYGYKYTIKGTFGDDVTLIGYPAVEGNGSCINFFYALAISSKCAKPEGAWQFVRHFLTEEYQTEVGYGFPASMKAFDTLGEKATERSYWENPETGEKEYYDDTYWLGNESITMDLLNAGDIAKLKSQIIATTRLKGSVNDIISIIDEEAQAFFEGQKSAEEVAKIIQSRATIFISEKQ